MKLHYRNSSYIEHFEDYQVEELEDTKRGRVKVRMKYTGDYYQQKGSWGQVLARRISYLLLFTVSATVFVLCASRTTIAYHSPYIMITQMGIVLGLIWTLFKLVFYFFSKMKMTIGEYKGSSRGLIRICIATAICFLAFSCGHVFYMFREMKSENYRIEIENLIGYVVSGGFIAGIGLWEGKVKYIITSTLGEDSDQEGKE